jgi:heme oxygenase (biliverdin-producing, ferredoxin)
MEGDRHNAPKRAKNNTRLWRSAKTHRRHFSLQDQTSPRGRGGQADGLAERLRQETQSLHIQAERSGIIRDLLKGQASRHGYALLIRNVLPAYQRMEDGFAASADAPGIRVIHRPALERAAAIRSDLTALYGDDWADRLPLLPAGEAYAETVAAAAKSDDARLIAHAYVRYMGDLSGGQILRRILIRTLGLEPDALSLYEFPQITDIETFKTDYREAFDRAGLEIGDVRGVLDEGAEAFRQNIAVSEAVRAAAEAAAPGHNA